MYKLKNILMTMVFISSSSAHADVRIIKSDSFLFIKNAVINTIEKSTNQENLLVGFDIDKTLLITESCIPFTGLSGWVKMIKECPSTLTEPDVASDVSEIQKTGTPTMALTARPVQLQAVTEKWLTSFGITFLDKPYGIADDFQIDFNKSAKIYFKGGIVYATGRNKGLVLKEFTKKIQEFSKIIFIDDDIKNVKNIEKAYLNNQDVPVEIYHYTKYK